MFLHPFLSFLQTKKLWAGVLLVLFFTACQEAPQLVYPSPKGYQLDKPEVRKLPVELDEISGLSYVANDKSLYAIQDERGLLYKIHPFGQHNIERWAFAKGGDYEDVVVLGQKFYVLKSNGAILVFQFDPKGSVIGTEYPMTIVEDAEFESLYYEPQTGKLLLICKDCPQDKKKTVSTFAFNPATNTFEFSALTIDASGIAGAMGQKSVKFKPSAAAIHPFTGELFVVSAVNKMLVVTDRHGRTQAVYMLPPNFYKQPEGIAFAPDGTLFISNEAADIGVADILIYKYTRPEIRK